MGEDTSQRDILQTFFTQSDISVPNPTIIIQISRTASTFLFLNIPKVSTPHELSFFPINSYIQPLHLDKSRVDWKQDKGQYVYGLYILLCWTVYYSILTLFCMNISENFNSFHFSHTIIYTSLNSNITNFPLTHHIRVSSL